MNTDPIVVEQTFHLPLSEVWQAVTDRDRMRQWFFRPMTEFQPEVGFETQFNVSCEEVEYLHCWKVTDVAPERRLVLGWRYEGYPGDSSVTFELSEEPEGTKLTLTHAGHETFPQDDPVFSREAGQLGWEYFVQESLKAHLEGE